MSDVARGVDGDAVGVVELGRGRRAAVAAVALVSIAGDGVDVAFRHGRAVEGAGGRRHDPDAVDCP